MIDIGHWQVSCWTVKWPNIPSWHCCFQIQFLTLCLPDHVVPHRARMSTASNCCRRL